jgi:hypothetical protein
VSISYFPQIHLHTFVTHNHGSVRRVSAGPTVYRDRVLWERAGERIYADKGTGEFLWRERAYRAQRAHRSLPIEPNSNTSTPRLAIETSPTRLLARRGPRASISTKIQQPRKSASLKIRPPLLLHTRVEESSKILKTYSYLREHEHRSQVFSYLSASHETHLKTSRTQFDRAEELVWRDVTVANVTQTTNQKPVGAPTVSTHAESASSSSNKLTPQQITKLDPGLLDRLTDDVIRRVEKRARIERQRRGL